MTGWYTHMSKRGTNCGEDTTTNLSIAMFQKGLISGLFD